MKSLWTKIDKIFISNNGVFFTKKKIIKKNKKNNFFYLKYKEAARRLISKKVEEFNLFYNYKINKISIRDQKTRWASCSRSANLNFNYKIIFLPEDLINYIVVHELCHLGEFNHSKNFWKLLEKKIPNYLVVRKKLKYIRINF